MTGQRSRHCLLDDAGAAQRAVIGWRAVRCRVGPGPAEPGGTGGWLAECHESVSNRKLLLISCYIVLTPL